MTSFFFDTFYTVFTLTLRHVMSFSLGRDLRYKSQVLMLWVSYVDIQSHALKFKSPHLTMWLYFGDRVGKEVVKVKWGRMSLICVLIRRDQNIDTQENHVKTQGEDVLLQTKERGLTRNQPCQHLDLRLPASRTVRIKFSVV